MSKTESPTDATKLNQYLKWVQAEVNALIADNKALTDKLSQAESLLKRTVVHSEGGVDLPAGHPIIEEITTLLSPNTDTSLSSTGSKRPPYPDCMKHCDAVQELGLSECKNCNNKLKDTGKEPEKKDDAD